MTNNKKQIMQFLFGGRELILMVADLLSAPVDVIVNPAKASGYSDALDFKKAGISLEEYQAMLDISRYLENR